MGAKRFAMSDRGIMQVNNIELAMSEFVAKSHERLRAPVGRSQQFNP